MSVNATMSDNPTFASGRYSKRKRTQITYFMDEMDVSDCESDFETALAKKRKATTPQKTTTPRKQVQKKKIFPFLRLPAEIRNMIYECTLYDESGINMVGTFRNKRRSAERVSSALMVSMNGNHWYGHRINDRVRAINEEPNVLCPALLSVNKQIHAEARDFLYSNDFNFLDTQALYSFALNAGPAGLKNIKSIRLLRWGYGRALKSYNHSCFALLAMGMATNIENFYLETFGRWFNEPKHSAEQVYRDAFPWLEAIGAAKGKVDAAVDVIKVDPKRFEKTTRDFNGNDRVIMTAEEGYEKFCDTMSGLLIRQHERIMKADSKKEKRKAKKAAKAA